MERDEVVRQGETSGFSAAQIDFLLEAFAVDGHSHEAEDIIVDPEDGETLDEYMQAVNESIFPDDDAGEGAQG